MRYLKLPSIVTHHGFQKLRSHGVAETLTLRKSLRKPCPTLRKSRKTDYFCFEIKTFAQNHILFEKAIIV